MHPFHAFFYVHDISASIHFYQNVLGCPVHIASDTSFSIDFFGHGISFEYHQDFTKLPVGFTCDKQEVDARQYVPSVHWGINLTDKNIFDALRTRLEQLKIDFLVKPTLYNKAQKNEQCLFFMKDPTGYIIEFRFMSRAFHLHELEKWDQRSAGHARE